MTKTKTRTIICKNDEVKDFYTLRNIFFLAMHEFFRDFMRYPDIVYMGRREFDLLMTSQEYRHSLLWDSRTTKSRNPRKKFQGMSLRMMKTDGMRFQIYKK